MMTPLKRAAEWLLLASGIATLTRALRRGRALVLAFHNIVPDGERPVGDTSLHLPQRSFARQLDLLVNTHDVVPLADLARVPDRGARPRLVLTFDDAYRGAVTAGIAEVARRGLPATIFVAPAFIGGGSFWWDVFADAQVGALEPGTRQEALDRFAGRDRDIQPWAMERGLPRQQLPWHATVADDAELAQATRAPGVTLGSHSWSHPNLTRLPEPALREELERPLAWLRQRALPMVPWLAYPYGLTSTVVREAAAAAGYEGALRVDGGWVPTGGESRDWHALPRLNVPAGMSPANLALRASGALA